VTDIGTGSTDIESIGDGGGTADQVKDQVREKAQVAQDKARGAIGQARGRLSDQVDQRSTQAGERIAGTAGDVRSIADQLRNQGKDAPATLAEQLASQADRVGDYLKGASGDRILRDVEDFARRQPMLVAAAGLALGFAASRFLRPPAAAATSPAPTCCTSKHSHTTQVRPRRPPYLGSRLHGVGPRHRDPLQPSRCGLAGHRERPFGHTSHHASRRAHRPFPSLPVLLDTE